MLLEVKFHNMKGLSAKGRGDALLTSGVTDVFFEVKVGKRKSQYSIEKIANDDNKYTARWDDDDRVFYIDNVKMNEMFQVLVWDLGSPALGNDFLGVFNDYVGKLFDGKYDTDSASTYSNELLTKQTPGMKVTISFSVRWVPHRIFLNYRQSVFIINCNRTAGFLSDFFF